MERIVLAITGGGTIHQDRGDYDIESFRIEAEGLATLELAVRMTGAPVPPIGDPMATGLLHGFRLSVQDAGLTARALAGAARLSGMTEAELRAQVIEAIGMIEGMLGGAGAPATPPQAAAPDDKGGAQPPPPESKLGPQAAPQPPAAAAGGSGIVGSLRGFLERPGSITITARPAQPIPFSDLAGDVGGPGPEALMRRLGLRVEIQ